MTKINFQVSVIHGLKRVAFANILCIQRVWGVHLVTFNIYIHLGCGPKFPSDQSQNVNFYFYFFSPPTRHKTPLSELVNQTI